MSIYVQSHEDLTLKEFKEFQDSLWSQAASCRKPDWLALKRTLKN